MAIFAQLSSLPTQAYGDSFLAADTGQSLFAPLEGAIVNIVGGASGNVIGTGLGDHVSLGSGAVSLYEPGGNNTILFTSGYGQVMAGGGANTFVFTGNLSGLGSTAEQPPVDTIFDFHGAGAPLITANKDFIDFMGYGVGAHLVFLGNFPGRPEVQYYQVQDITNTSHGNIVVQMSDGTNHLTAGTDYAFL